MAVVTEQSGSWTTTHTNGTGDSKDVYRISTTKNEKRVVTITVTTALHAEPSTAKTEENMKALHTTISTAVKNAIGTAF